MSAPKKTHAGYVTRWRSKGGIEALSKACHLLDMLVSFEKGCCTSSAE